MSKPIVLHLLLHTEIRSILEGLAPLLLTQISISMCFASAGRTCRSDGPRSGGLLASLPPAREAQRRTDVTDVTRKRRGDREDPRFDPPVAQSTERLGRVFDQLPGIEL